MIKYTEKVVGSTFANINTKQLFPTAVKPVSGSQSNVPTKVFPSYIRPEGTNKYDSNAKRVYVLVANENGIIEEVPIGYLKRDGELYNKTKVNTCNDIKCEVTMKAYNVFGMNDSYVIDVELNR